MQFKILGANAESGDDVDVLIQAPSQSDVENIAHDKGILVASVTAIAAPPASATTTTVHPPAHTPKPDLEAISLVDDEPGAAPHAAGVITVNANAPSGTAT